MLVEVLSVGRDVTGRRELQELLRVRSERDELTGLYNRSATMAALERLVAETGSHRRSSDGLGVLYIDLDGFKQINDAHGHACGDRALVAVADCLRIFFRPSDVIGRIGGDEFVVICPGAPHEEGLRGQAGALRAEIAGLDVRVRASIGEAFLVEGEASESLLHRADQAMYHDKHRRRRIAPTKISRRRAPST